MEGRVEESVEENVEESMEETHEFILEEKLEEMLGGNGRESAVGCARARHSFAVVRGSHMDHGMDVRTRQQATDSRTPAFGGACGC